MIRGQRRPGRKWTARDRALLVALQAYEDDCCPGCGQPRTYGMDDDAHGRYPVHSATCHACAALDRADAARGDKKPPPGHRQYVAPDPGLTYAMHHPIHVPPFAT